MSKIIERPVDKINLHSRYNPSYGEMLVNHMSEGKSFAAFAGLIGVSYSTLTKWRDQNPEFNEAYEIAKMASLGAWEDLALDQAKGTIKGNASSLIFTLKNRFSDFYKDKQEVEHGGNVQFVIDTGVPNTLQEALEYEEAIEVESTPTDELDLL